MNAEWKKDWVSQEWDLNVPAEPSGFVQHITIVSFFLRWLFWLFPMVTPHSTTTAMLNRALREKRDANLEPRSPRRPALLQSAPSFCKLQHSSQKLDPGHYLTKHCFINRPRYALNKLIYSSINLCEQTLSNNYRFIFQMFSDLSSVWLQ